MDAWIDRKTQGFSTDGLILIATLLLRCGKPTTVQLTLPLVAAPIAQSRQPASAFARVDVA